jgi:hypothetical protein
LYETRRFITVFTRALHWSLFSPRSIQSIPSHPIALRSILILSTHLRLGPPSGLFPSVFPTNILYAFRFSFIRAACLLDSIILIILIPVFYVKYNWGSVIWLYQLTKLFCYLARRFILFTNRNN